MKKKTKRKINKKRILLLLIVLFLLYFLLSALITTKIKNIYVYGNTYLNDSEIIRILKLDKYPSFMGNAFFLNKRVTEDSLIEKIEVSRGWFKLYIQVTEKEPLYTYNNKIYFEDKTINSEVRDVPVLLNYIPDTISKEFNEKFAKVDKEVRLRVSEIEYSPNEADEERFIFYMKDNNQVYINLSKMNLVNDYVNIILRLKEEKEVVHGILYLDSGKYFESF